MKNFKLITILVTGLSLSSVSFANQHDKQGWYVGFDGGFNAVDGHCDQVPSVIHHGTTASPTVLTVTGGSITVTPNPGTGTEITRSLATTELRMRTQNNRVDKCADSNLSLTGNLGYKFNRNMSVEGYYSTISPFDLTAIATVPFPITLNDQGGNPQYNATPNLEVALKDEISLDSSGFNFKVQYDYQPNVFIQGKLGVHFWREKHIYTPTIASSENIAIYQGSAQTSQVATGSYTGIEIALPEKFTRVVEDKNGTGVLLGLGGSYFYGDNTAINGGIDIMTGDINTMKFYGGFSYRF